METRANTISVKTITRVGIFTAMTCILAPLSVPIGPVPISLTNLVIYFGLYVLGTKLETISYCVYLLIGLVGVPVFSGFSGGPQKLFGPTGGYLIGFLPMAVIAGVSIKRASCRMLGSMVGMILGTAVCYIMGTAWLAFEAKLTFGAALMAGVVPFLPGDFVKMLLAALAAPQIRKRLQAAGLIEI